MLDFPERADERDDALMRRLRQAIDDLRMYLRDWLQEEVKEARIELQVQEAIAQGMIRTEISAKLQRLDEIDHRILRELDRLVNEKIGDVEEGAYESPPEARLYMEEGIRAMESVLMELLIVRRFILLNRGETTPED